MKKTAIHFFLLFFGLFLGLSTAIAAEVSVFGPEQFVRTKAKPVAEIHSFSAYEDESRIVVTNGDENGKNRVSSATVSVNAVEIFKTKDFNQNVDVLEAPVNLFTDNSISVELNSAPESFLTIQILQESAFSIAITSPANNEVISKPYVMVTGAVGSPTGGEIGVVVNGYPAQVAEGEFFASNIPLAVGENTLAATAIDPGGTTATASVNVIFDPAVLTDWIKLNVNPESGVAPLEVRLFADLNLSFSPTSSSLISSMPNDVTISQISVTEYDLVFSYPGVYDLTYTVTDSEGSQSQQEIKVNVFDRVVFDATLRAKWGNLKSALLSQDVAAASGYFTKQTQALYYEIYAELLDDLPQIAQDMQDVQLIYVEEDVAKYRIRKNEMINGQPEEITYYIYFAVDEDGLWKIFRY